jgi:signal transduction histidine kinase
VEPRKILLKDSLRALPVRIKKLLVAPVQHREKGKAVTAKRDDSSREERGAPIPPVKNKAKPQKSRWQQRRRIRARLTETKKHAQQLEEINRLQAEFVANVSHEFRTPLNGILGYSQLLSDGLYGELPRTQLEVLDHIRTCGNHLLDLVNEMLDLSRLKKHQVQLDLTSVSPLELIEAAAAAVHPLAKQRRLNLITTCEPDLPILSVDFRRLYQVLLNLLSNAIKFTHEGSVEVGARRDGKNVRFHVKDTGVGIAPEFSRYVFKEFRQNLPILSPPTQKKDAEPDGIWTQPFGGIGLGLSLSKRLVELHGGKIAYITKQKEGTEFYFFIPIP